MNLNNFSFYKKENYSGKDQYFFSNTNSYNIDYLFFFDSRGISSGYNNSLVKLIETKYSRSHKIIIISRPLYITTWSTLYNFLKLNNLKFKTLVTNMGFVDYTPKKKIILEDYIFQFN